MVERNASGLDRRRQRPRRPVRWLVLWAALGPTLGPACEETCSYGDTCVEDSGMRLLDRVCAVRRREGDGCELQGAAERTTGLTADSIGFRLGGPGGEEGSLAIDLSAVQDESSRGSVFRLEVLVASSEPGSDPRLTVQIQRGTCSSCGSDFPPEALGVGDEYTWVTVMNIQDAASEIGGDAIVTLSGAGVDIADMRSFSSYDVPGCM